jgi:hypothetical protein
MKNLGNIVDLLRRYGKRFELCFDGGDHFSGVVPGSPKLPAGGDPGCDGS